MIKRNFSRFLSHFVITKNKVIRSEIKSINEILTAQGKDSIVRVLEIGPGQNNFYSERYSFKDINVHLTLLEANSINISGSISKRFKTRIVQGIAPFDLSKFGDKKFDVVICSHVIEHLPKDKGYVLLYELDRITKFISLISTPNGFSWQTPLDATMQRDWYNAHLSAWTPRELKYCGYKKQFGEVGPKILFGPGAATRFNFNYFGRLLLGVIYPIIQRFPGLSYAFSAVKKHSPTSKDYLRL
jgi:hypothetical protein